jgi:hypothetical protein
VPFVPILNATQVNVIGSLMGQQYENVWAVQTADPPLVADLLTVASIFETAYAAILNPLSQELVINEIDCRYLGSAAGPVTQLFSESVPGNVALCVKLSSALPGRQFRGRKYFGGFTEAQISYNQVDPVVANDITAAIAGLITALTTNGTPLSIVSKTHGTLVPVIGAGIVDLYVDSQRRRLPGRGR